MPKINRVRIVNFSYNDDNRHIFDEVFNYYGGQNTLMNLGNGGEKTVLVQTIMQPILPLIKVGGRVFKDVFKRNSSPSYILIEWLLGNNGGYVVTGIGIKRKETISRNEDSSDVDTSHLKYYTFVIEYNRPNKFDIVSLPLVDNSEGVTRVQEYEKIAKMLSSEKDGPYLKVKLYRDSSDDRQEYACKLEEYKIYVKEWRRLILKINEEEGGIAKTFANCKTSQRLMRDWIIPAVDEQVNKNERFIEQYSSMIRDHARDLINSQKAIKEKAVYENFTRDFQKLLDVLKKHDETSVLISQCEKDIYGLYLLLKKQVAEIEVRLSDITEKINTVDAQLKEVDYDKKSLQYHETDKRVKELTEEYDLICSKVKNAEERLNSLKYQKEVYDAARIYNDIVSEQSNLAASETRLQVLLDEEKDIKKDIADIEYSLKVKYKTLLDAIERDISGHKEKYSKICTELSEYKDKTKWANEQKTELSNRVSALKAKEEAFEKKKEDLAQKYNIVFQSNILKEIEEKEFARYINGWNKEIESSELKIKALEEEKINLEKDISSFEDKKSGLNLFIKNKSVEKAALEKDIENYIKEEEVVLKYLSYFGIPKEKLFDRESNLKIMDEQLSGYQKNRDELLMKIFDTEQEIKTIDMGGDLTIPYEVIQFMRDNDIDFVTGSQYLQNSDMSEEKKQELISKNPLIPYAIILSEKEIEYLKTLKVDFYTNVAVPVINRKNLDFIDMKVDGFISTFDSNMLFITAYNEKLIDKDEFEKHKEGLHRKVSSLRQVVSELEEFIKSVNDRINVVKAFDFDINYKTEKEILLKACEEEIRKAEDEIQALTDKMELSRKRIENIGQEINRENDKIKENKSLIERIVQFKADYQVFIEEYKEQMEKTTELEQIKKQIVFFENNVEELSNKERELDQYIKEKERENKEISKKYTQYESSSGTVVIELSIDELEAKRNVLMSKISGDINELKSAINQMKTRIEENSKLLETMEVNESDYKAVHYDGDKYKKILSDIKEAEKQLGDIKKTAQECLVELERTKEKARIILNEINETYKREPKGIELIDIDFEGRKKRLAALKSDLNTNLTENKNLYDNYKSEMNKFEILVESLDGENLKGCEAWHEMPENLRKVRESMNKKLKELKEGLNATRDEINDEYRNLNSNYADSTSVISDTLAILNDGRTIDKYNYLQVSRRLETTLSVINSLIQKYTFEIENLEKYKDYIIERINHYALQVYEGVKAIDRNSYIEVNGHRVKMLKIELPEADIMSKEAMKRYIENCIDDIVKNFEDEKKIGDILAAKINTAEILSVISPINNCRVMSYKIDINASNSGYKKWEEVLTDTSGGEKFVAFFVLFISLLSYMRNDGIENQANDGKVLLMDNPFGPITSEHLLKPMFDIAKKYNTQLICLSDIKQSSVYERFDVICMIKVKVLPNRKSEYLSIEEMVRKDGELEYLEKASYSKLSSEQMSLFDLA
ncbi:MAG TPA: hypothetical protein PK604_03760 [Acetivibrio clariflavus]|nr:hypothetical protein [Acetivibrio clariflavus]